MERHHVPYEILEDQSFQKLYRKRNLVTGVLTLINLVVYYGFILLIAFRGDLLAYRITSSITLGILVGIGVILVAWLLTGIYVWWANHEYDSLVEQVRENVRNS